MPDNAAVNNYGGEPRALGSASSLLIAIMVGAAIGLNVFLFGLDLWIALKFGILLSAVALRTGNVTGGLVAGLATMGLDFAIYLFGFWVWPSALLGVIGIFVITNHLTSAGGQQTNSGDQNPVVYIAMIIAIRAFLALVYTEVNALGSFNNNILQWLTVFVIGIVPGFPILANILLSLVLNGTLLVYLVLLLKRIANPLAN